jgi:hypothetical protein
VSELRTREQIILRLQEIDDDLAARQVALERAAMAWFRAKRDREHRHAVVFRATTGTVAERNAAADEQSALIGADAEAEFEALRAVVRVLDTRATIGATLLKAEREEHGPQPSWTSAIGGRRG